MTTVLNQEAFNKMRDFRAFMANFSTFDQEKAELVLKSNIDDITDDAGHFKQTLETELLAVAARIDKKLAKAYEGTPLKPPFIYADTLEVAFVKAKKVIDLDIPVIHPASPGPSIT